MSVYDIVRKAIRNKEIIVATYDGFVREMCPHVLGTKDGVEHALFLQVDGGSRKGLDPDPSKNWRCIKLDKLTSVAVNMESGGPRPTTTSTRRAVWTISTRKCRRSKPQVPEGAIPEM